MRMLLLICELFKVIIVIKKQFSLATLTLKILQDQLFNPFLGASHILKHNGYGSHWESWVWNMGKQIWSCVVQQPVCWGPAHLGSLHIAAGYFYHLGQITSTAIPLPCWLAGSRKVPKCHCKWRSFPSESLPPVLPLHQPIALSPGLPSIVPGIKLLLRPCTPELNSLLPFYLWAFSPVPVPHSPGWQEAKA